MLKIPKDGLSEGDYLYFVGKLGDKLINDIG